MYIDLVRYLEEIETALGSSSLTVQKRMKAFQDFPSLKAFSVLGEVLLCTDETNQYATHVDFIAIGKKVYAKPFIDDKGQAIYSEPPVFEIGTYNSDGFGIDPRGDWKEAMENAKLPKKVLMKCQDFLAKHPKVNYE